MADALSFYGYDNTSETERFVRLFDKFFDCLNVRSTDEYIQQRKPNLRPYTEITDEQLTVRSYLCSMHVNYTIATIISLQPKMIAS